MLFSWSFFPFLPSTLLCRSKYFIFRSFLLLCQLLYFPQPKYQIVNFPITENWKEIAMISVIRSMNVNSAWFYFLWTTGTPFLKEQRLLSRTLLRLQLTLQLKIKLPQMYLSGFLNKHTYDNLKHFIVSLKWVRLCHSGLLEVIIQADTSDYHFNRIDWSSFKNKRDFGAGIDFINIVISNTCYEDRLFPPTRNIAYDFSCIIQ